MGFKLNLTADEIKDAQGGFTPLPEGIYGAVVYTAKFGKSKAGNPMYTLDYKITGGPEVRKNFKIKGWYTLKANALFGIIGLHKALGFPYPKGADDAGEFEFPDAEEYEGNQVNLRIVQEPYDSEDDEGNPIVLFRNNIKAVLPYDEDKWTSEEDAENPSADGDSSLFLT